MSINLEVAKNNALKCRKIKKKLKYGYKLKFSKSKTLDIYLNNVRNIKNHIF